MSFRKQIKIKRAYEDPAHDDGLRILIDRLWPRGLSKARAQVDLWLKDLAPSSTLRRWFNHDPARWVEFRRRYARELDAKGVRQGGDAIRHLFLVAASLDSLIVGEGQIAGQVKEAYEKAQARDAVGPLLHALFRHARQVRQRAGRLQFFEEAQQRQDAALAAGQREVGDDVIGESDDRRPIERRSRSYWITTCCISWRCSRSESGTKARRTNTSTG